MPLSCNPLHVPGDRPEMNPMFSFGDHRSAAILALILSKEVWDELRFH